MRANKKIKLTKIAHKYLVYYTEDQIVYYTEDPHCLRAQ